MEKLQIPDGFRAMTTQVAGHTFQMDTQAIGLLQDTANGCVLKPLGKPACGERELSFYKTLNEADDDSLLAQARMFVPRFHHSLKLIVNQREHMFLKLEDLTHCMELPCIMDVKIGKRTWDPAATPQKRAVEEEKYIKCKQVLGLCLPGFQVYQPSKEGVKLLRYSKDFGKKIDANGFRETIILFLNAQRMLCEPLVNEILQQLYTIRDWFNIQTLMHFYASSLLIAYDFAALQAYMNKYSTLNGQKDQAVTNGNAQNIEKRSIQIESDHHNHKRDNLLSPRHWIKVKMIDFAHVFPAESNMLDTNYLFGLRNMITILEELVAR